MLKKALLKLIACIFIGLLGLFFLWWSGTIAETLPSESYTFDLDVVFYNDSQEFSKNHPVSYFLLDYDFTTKKGNITFAVFDDPIKDFTIRFPRLVPHESLDIKLKKCYNGNINCSQSVPGINPKVDPQDDKNVKIPYTYVTVSDFARPMGTDERIVISFELNMRPNGIFSFIHVNNRINFGKGYTIDFKLGSKYICYDKCVVDVGGHMSESEESEIDNLKLAFLNNDGQNVTSVHKVKITSKLSNISSFLKIPRKNLLFGLGVSIIASALVLIILELPNIPFKRKRRANVVLILLGQPNSYKTSIIRQILHHHKRRAPASIPKGDTLWCAYSFDSPQEKNAFCMVKDVNEDINKRLIWCEEERKTYNCKNFVLLLPFTITKKKGSLNVDCITLPIMTILQQDYDVKVIYLDKKDRLIREILQQLPIKPIIKDEYEDQLQEISDAVLSELKKA